MIEPVPVREMTTVAPPLVRLLLFASLSWTVIVTAVPTVTEAGLSGYEATIWLGLMAPAGTPKPVIDTLFNAIVEASKQPALKEAFDKQLVSINVSQSPEEARTWLKSELALRARTKQETSHR